MDGDLESYAKLKEEGIGSEQACLIALKEGKDLAFQIRMLRAVYGLHIAVARDIAAKAYFGIR